MKFDDEQKYITYVHQKKKRNFANPEEQVQAKTFLKLILTYGYDPKRLRLFVPVTMGSAVKEADIIVYNDNQCLSPHIVVECKKQEISELEFTQAVEHAFSYAVAEGAKYVWVTSGIKESNDYLKQLEKIESDKKRHLKDLRGFENPQNLSGKALTDSELYKEWRKEVTAEYNDRIDALKESLSEQ